MRLEPRMTSLIAVLRTKYRPELGLTIGVQLALARFLAALSILKRSICFPFLYLLLCSVASAWRLADCVLGVINNCLLALQPFSIKINNFSWKLKAEKENEVLLLYLSKIIDGARAGS